MSNSSTPDYQIARLRIIAGPNGSGKSSYYNQLKIEVDTGIWINADELNTELVQKGYIEFDKFGSLPQTKDWNAFKRLKRSEAFISHFQLHDAISTLRIGKFVLSIGQKTDNNPLAALIADFLRYKLLKDHAKFTTETVYSHPSKIQLVKEATRLGYRTYLYFICTESPELNIERVKSRIVKGGHNVSSEKIIERYSKSINVLIESIPLYDRVFIFDNSKFEHRLIVSIMNGKVERFFSADIPAWVKHVTNNI